ncbi:two-component regulator propeller domain-containing protein [bacterium]
MFQDHLGFLWIANSNGWVRYDGYSFQIFQPDSANPYSIRGREIIRTDENSEGNLWISTRFNGINKFDRKTGQFFHYTHDPQDSTSLSSNQIFICYLDRSDVLWVVHQNGLLDQLDTKTGMVRRCRHNPDNVSTISHNTIYQWQWHSSIRLAALYEDKKGDIWIGTQGGGLNRYDKNTDSFVSYQHDPNNPNSISSDIVTSIYEDREENFWIGTWGGGLNRYLRETDTFMHYRHNPEDKNTLPNNTIQFIFEDKSNNLWLSVPNGLILFNFKNKTFTHYQHDPDNPYSLSSRPFAIPLYEDDSGLIWFLTSGTGGSDTVFDFFDPRQGKFFHCQEDLNNPQGLRALYIPSLCKDHSGNIWICTVPRGINKLNPLRQHIQHFLHEPNNPNSLCHNLTYAILESTSQPDMIWIGTVNGLNQYDQRTGVFTQLKHQPDNPNSLANNVIFSIREDRYGLLWIATGVGLSCYHSRKNQFKNYKYNPEDSTRSFLSNLWTICEDHLGTIWLGSTGMVLIRYQRENDSFTSYIHHPEDSQSITSGQVWCIDEDREGVLWIGTNTGLNKFNPGDQTFTHYLTDRTVFVIHEDKNNNLWLACPPDGLALFNRQTGEAHFYDQKQGLCNNKINSIVEDDNGFLWLATEGGVSKFNPRTKEFTNFSEEHGFPTQLFNTNGTKLKNGQIWLTTIDNGIVGFDPKQVKINTIPPKIVLTDIRLFNESLKIGPDLPLKQDISITKEIAFAHWQNDITIECTALHFSCPEKNQYAFWMENYDKDWYDTGTNRFATYTNLDPGEYIFHAKGSNSDNVWNEDGVSLRIIIHPPWWRTFWAYGLYVLIIGSIGFVIWQNQLRRIQLRNALKMKQFEAQKLQEIDQLKSRFFANISHEFRTPLTLILGPMEQLLSGKFKGNLKETYRIIIRNGKRLLQLINQLLDLSKLEAGRMTLKAGPLDIIGLLKALVLSFSSLAERKKISLTFKAEKESIIVYADKDKLEKIVLNLLSNAFKYTPAGGTISVTVTASSKTDQPIASTDDEFVDIRIADTGPGISGEHLEKIFDRFYQVHETHDERSSTGIGLALVKELVELHRGKIFVDSKIDEGTEFTVRLPLGKTHLKEGEIEDKPIAEAFHGPVDADLFVAEVNSSRAIEKESATPDEEATIVLIVEDNSDVRSYIREILEPFFRIMEAQDGQKGFNKAVEFIPNLVISDIMMPKMDGYQLCKNLKTDERTSHIPIILLTARAAGESKLEGLETGADDYIIKPFDSKELLVRVKNLIKIRQQLRQRFSREIVLKPQDIAITPMDAVFLQKVQSVVNEHLDDEDFTIEMLGHEVGMSRSQIHRKLRALIDQSASRFIRSMRLQRAVELMKKRAGNIAEIAYMTGFHSQAYFTTCFHEQFGCSPKEYLKNIL